MKRALLLTSLVVLLGVSLACSFANQLLQQPAVDQPPAVAQHKALPCLSVMVIIVLLNDACTCTKPSETTRLAFFLVFVPLLTAILVPVIILLTNSKRLYACPYGCEHLS